MNFVCFFIIITNDLLAFKTELQLHPAYQRFGINKCQNPFLVLIEVVSSSVDSIHSN